MLDFSFVNLRSRQESNLYAEKLIYALEITAKDLTRYKDHFKGEEKQLQSAQVGVEFRLRTQ